VIRAYAADVRRVVTEFILDLDGFKNVIGVEILALTEIAGCDCLNEIEENVPAEGDGLRYSYDAESDSFYLQLSNEASKDQIALDGILVLDRAGAIVALECSLAD
jgi:uncharacterized protein YuzE